MSNFVVIAKTMLGHIFYLINIAGGEAPEIGANNLSELMIGRCTVFVFGLILLILAIVAEPMNTYINHLESLLIYQDNYIDKKTGVKHIETFRERVRRLFWPYFIFSNTLGGCLLCTQLGISGITESPFKWYIYFIATGFICFLARTIKITPFVEEDRKGMSHDLISHLFIISILGTLMAFVHFCVLWVVNPEELLQLIVIPFSIVYSLLDVVMGLITFVIVVLIFPLFLASFGEGTIILFCKIWGKYLRKIFEKKMSCETNNQKNKK